MDCSLVDRHQIEIGLRVLSAVTSRMAPSEADVEILRMQFPSEPDMPIDEMACVLVLRGVEQHTASREAKQQEGPPAVLAQY